MLKAYMEETTLGWKGRPGSRVNKFRFGVQAQRSFRPCPSSVTDNRLVWLGLDKFLQPYPALPQCENDVGSEDYFRDFESTTTGTDVLNEQIAKKMKLNISQSLAQIVRWPTKRRNNELDRERAVVGIFARRIQRKMGPNCNGGKPRTVIYFFRASLFSRHSFRSRHSSFLPRTPLLSPFEPSPYMSPPSFL